MKRNIRVVFKVIVVSVSILMIVLSGLSFVHEISLWYAKVVDFPRLQYLILSLICLVLFWLLNRRWNVTAVLLVIGLFSSIAIHSIKIAPYFLGEKVVPDVERQEKGTHAVKIIIANVLITNRNADKFLELIKKHDPDVVLTMEVNEWWVNHLRSLEKDYPYKVEHPLDNAYGMALYSKLTLKNVEKKFLKHADVPSFHVIMTLPSGQEFTFHGIHPVAPIPSKKYPDNLGEKEVALSKVGSIVAERELPSIVAGDFNDVSWSRSSRFFEKKGDLRNVRIGRGLYNSFNANSLIKRWPLDHFFVTEEFQLKELKRLERFGSDHFPMLAEFVLPPTN